MELKKLSEMTDREIQEAILNNLRKISSVAGTIKSIIIFYGIVTIIGLILTVIGLKH